MEYTLPDIWENSINHCNELEEKYWANDNIIDTFLDEFEIDYNIDNTLDIDFNNDNTNYSNIPLII